MLRKIFILIFLLAQIFIAGSCFAADIGRYQVVTSGEDNAYLVDTATGFVWFLGYRTLPTGREPVAIPYKYILKTPQNQGAFLTEKLPGIVTPSKDDKESK